MNYTPKHAGEIDLTYSEELESFLNDVDNSRRAQFNELQSALRESELLFDSLEEIKDKIESWVEYSESKTNEISFAMENLTEIPDFDDYI